MLTSTNIQPVQVSELVWNFDKGMIKMASLESFLNVDLSADAHWPIASEVLPGSFQ